MASTRVKGSNGREYLRSEDGTRQAGSIGRGVEVTSKATINMQPLAAAADSRGEIERLIDAGIVPSDTPIPAPLAAEIDFENDDRAGLFYVAGEPVLGTQADVRREQIGSSEDTLITFRTEGDRDVTGNIFERDSGGVTEFVAIDYRGLEVEARDDSEGLDQALRILSWEAENNMGPEYVRAAQTLATFYEHGLAAEEDLIDAMGHLAYLREEVQDGADVGEWSSHPRVLDEAFFALAASVPTDVACRFAEEQYGRSAAETMDRFRSWSQAGTFDEATEQNPLL